MEAMLTSFTASLYLYILISEVELLHFVKADATVTNIILDQLFIHYYGRLGEGRRTMVEGLHRGHAGRLEEGVKSVVVTGRFRYQLMQL